MGRRSVRPVEQIPWVERSPERCKDDFRYSARAKLRSCAWRRQGKGTVSVQALVAKASVEGFGIANGVQGFSVLLNRVLRVAPARALIAPTTSHKPRHR